MRSVRARAEPGGAGRARTRERQVALERTLGVAASGRPGSRGSGPRRSRAAKRPPASVVGRREHRSARAGQRRRGWRRRPRRPRPGRPPPSSEASRSGGRRPCGRRRRVRTPLRCGPRACRPRSRRDRAERCRPAPGASRSPVAVVRGRRSRRRRRGRCSAPWRNGAAAVSSSNAARRRRDTGASARATPPRERRSRACGASTGLPLTRRRRQRQRRRPTSVRDGSSGLRAAAGVARRTASRRARASGASPSKSVEPDAAHASWAALTGAAAAVACDAAEPGVEATAPLAAPVDRRGARRRRQRRAPPRPTPGADQKLRHVASRRRRADLGGDAPTARSPPARSAPRRPSDRPWSRRPSWRTQSPPPLRQRRAGR